VSYSKCSGYAVALLTLVPMLVNGQRAQTAVPLKNWAVPLYWQPNQAERGAAGTALPQLLFSANAVSTNALTFVAITPCRLVDTRGAAAGFNGAEPFAGPSIASKATLTIPVQSPTEATGDTTPAPCGVIPSIAQAYSFNITVVPHAGGAVDYVSLWPAGGTQPFVATLNDPQGANVSNAAIVPAGPAASPGYGGVSVYNDGPATTDVVIDMNGYFAAPSDLNGNTAIGVLTLAGDNTGKYNTATGSGAMQNNTTGYDSTANGYQALQSNTTGSGNTATGNGSLQENTTGAYNTGNGYLTLYNTGNGIYNTASGASAMQDNSSGSYNTAVGSSALQANTTGNNNISIGFQAGISVTGTNSNNIDIGSEGSAGDGTASDSGVIRIGTAGMQTSFFAAGVSGVGVSGAPVIVNSSGQLGVALSSRRYKEDIQDMGEASSGLMRLRPVTFRYKQPYEDGSKPVDYGLIAEEVAEVYPDLAVKGLDGQVQTIQYQKLTPMLLNEVQKQAEQIRQQAEQIRSLEGQSAEIQSQNALIRALEARLAALEAQR
jgi:hypothetical protein